jgi:hypothetical protein
MKLDDFDTQVQCEELVGFVPSEEDYRPFEDDEDYLDEEEDVDVWVDLDEDTQLPYTVEEDVFFDENGGLTAEGYNLLADMDASGAFV